MRSYPGDEEEPLTKPVTYLNPPSSTPPAGMYSHVARMAPGELAFIAGQVAVDRSGATVGVGDVGAQLNQVLVNLGDILKDLGTGFESIVQLTTYLTSADSIPPFMEARGALFPKLFLGGAYPPNTLLVIDRLVKPEFLIEVAAIARVPG
jgi:enamine deaminase RidA (YjgF/YER057c/UK114 family)